MFVFVYVRTPIGDTFVPASVCLDTGFCFVFFSSFLVTQKEQNKEVCP